MHADPLGLLVAFGAGMLSFVSPCVLPLVPGYVSMVSGLSAEELAWSSHGTRSPDATGTLIAGRPTRGAVMKGIGGFVVGFSLVFTALGAAASSLGQLLLHHQRGLDMVAGAVVVLFGLWMFGIGVPMQAMRERRFHPSPARLGAWAPLVLGMAFAFGWTPCIGPVLGGVLGLAATRATLVSGVVLLASYSLGLAVPFVLTGLASDRLTSLLARLQGRLWLVDTVGGGALVVFGALLLTGQLHVVSAGVADLLRAVGLGRLSVS